MVWSFRKKEKKGTPALWVDFLVSAENVKMSNVHFFMKRPLFMKIWNSTVLNQLFVVTGSKNLKI